jgi:hypothetical protein
MTFLPKLWQSFFANRNELWLTLIAMAIFFYIFSLLRATCDLNFKAIYDLSP